MDLKHPTTKIPQTPPHSLLTFTNGNTHHHSTYKECLKNHAVGIGRHAVDGCGEFMPLEPSSLQCAACGCHRNFHRREHITHFITTVAAAGTSTSPSLSPPPSPGQHLILSLGTAADHNHTAAAPEVVKSSERKRFRTKFSPEQKQKMLNFAEKVGWKMQRCDDKMIADFCNEIGIRRRVLKVWMHNNKYTKRDTTATTSANTEADAANTIDGDAGNQENGSSSSS